MPLPNGFRGVAHPKIEITLQVSDTVLMLKLVDNGFQFDPTQTPDPDVTSAVEERMVGGLGLYLIKTFADRVSYAFADGKNRLTLEHDLTPAAE